MEVWKIRRLDKKKKKNQDKFIGGIYATRILAVKAMPMLIRQFFRPHKKKKYDIWFSMTEAQVLAKGEYRNSKYSIHWVIESYEYRTEKTGWFNEREQEDNTDKWFDDIYLLKDKGVYELEIMDGTVVKAVFDEEYGFFSTGEEEIMAEDAMRFKEVSGLETAL